MICKECPLFKIRKVMDGAGRWGNSELGDCCKDPRKEERRADDPGCAYGDTLVKHGKRPNLVE